MKQLSVFIILLLIFSGLYGLFQPLPEGVNVRGNLYGVPNDSVHFFRDLTYIDQKGIRHSDQQIFDEVFRMIDEAESYVLVDMFLYNNLLGTATTSYRGLSGELTDALIKKKKENPETTIQVITDPVNIIYGGYVSEQFESLEENGIPVIITDLTALRDSNPIYSSFWRTFMQWIPVTTEQGNLTNLFDENKQKINSVAYLATLNFKANHRKIVIADYLKEDGVKRGFSVLVTSANPHDGSSAHTNTAIRIDDSIWKDAILSETAVANFSEADFIPPSEKNIESREGNVTVLLLTEKAIQERIISMLDSLKSGDSFDMAMFYLSDRAVIKAIKRADDRGVNIRIILDPNKDAFGRQKNGIPNRQVADELVSGTKGNISLRWCDTHGEQCHSKLLIFKKEGNISLIQGSANLTRRNIRNYNLETDVYISGDSNVTAIKDAVEYFETVWENMDDKIYTTEYDKYKDTNLGKKIWYRISEFTGLSTY